MNLLDPSTALGAALALLCAPYEPHVLLRWGMVTGLMFGFAFLPFTERGLEWHRISTGIRLAALAFLAALPLLVASGLVLPALIHMMTVLAVCDVTLHAGNVLRAHFRNPAPWQDRPVDPRIRPLVEALNRTGLVRSFASCEGHATRQRLPYLSFEADPGLALKLGAHLARLYKDGRLHHAWELETFFGEDGAIRFSLRVPHLSCGYDNPLAALRDFCWNRRPLDRDFALLAEELPKAIGTAGLPQSKPLPAERKVRRRAGEFAS